MNKSFTMREYCAEKCAECFEENNITPSNDYECECEWYIGRYE